MKWAVKGVRFLRHFHSLVGSNFSTHSLRQSAPLPFVFEYRRWSGIANTVKTRHCFRDWYIIPGTLLPILFFWESLVRNPHLILTTLPSTFFWIAKQSVKTFNVFKVCVATLSEPQNTFLMQLCQLCYWELAEWFFKRMLPPFRWKHMEDHWKYRIDECCAYGSPHVHLTPLFLTCLLSMHNISSILTTPLWKILEGLPRRLQLDCPPQRKRYRRSPPRSLVCLSSVIAQDTLEYCRRAAWRFLLCKAMSMLQGTMTKMPRV